jgi:nicotinate (nicotinamide) nucleotide adenylyltransferase/ribosome silencing factor RsfS/YbeB/iojap
MRIGLLGGAFNPPHRGHLKLAELALAKLGLDQLRLMPTARSPHKATAPDDDPALRLRLLRAALQDFSGPVTVEPLELERGGTSYTSDTLEELHRREPGHQWILVIGSDQLDGLPQWHRAARVLELASVAVAPRPGATAELPAALADRLRPEWSGAPGELVWLPGTGLDAASSAIRADLRAGRDAGAQLPPQVWAAIAAENPYREVPHGARMTLDPRLASLVEAARSKKAFRIRLVDVKGIASFTDAFAFMSGGSDRQNRAIADAIEDQLRAEGVRPLSLEGTQAGAWILMDYGDFVVHIMDEDNRLFYNLEGLWKQGRELELPAETHPEAAASGPS